MHQNKAPKQARKLPRTEYVRQVMRAGGPGGQHQNKTESAVRLIHIPTGISVESRSERSQATNFDLAMALLIAKVEEREADARMSAAQADYQAKRRAAFGGSHVRSYFLDRDRRVVDHQTGVSSNRPEEVLGGVLAPFVEAALRARVA